MFGEGALTFVMILFTYEREEECDSIIDDLKKNTVLEHLIRQCGGRYHTCSKSMNNQSEMSTLLERIERLITENNQSCYTAEIYNTELKFKEQQKDRERQKPDNTVQLPSEVEESVGIKHIVDRKGEATESEDNQRKDGHIQKNKEVAAEIIVTGYPLELMDGDAAHVPLIWVSAVLDELVKILGDQRVFVLSVLGIQSSGKSTMLNAMFGLQFAVSAGRCTRGAFMQLVRVSEEMKEELKFDYILVVDTEGLRALEQAEKTTIYHDNELATFVVGLGNLTLVNIFGENPAEMQDILQIVVQAFLRMKKVRLNPSCLFVHQNVGDITAGEKNMEGRRLLQEKLDEMTKLAAKEEDCDAQCFSDIIAFDVQSDVKYFAQLWEGSPPMAPPNPSCSENIDELRRKILSKISTNHGVTLSQFKSSISDLWNALLNENFVFSFRNTLEIAVYRKLEHKYTKWTWSLRSAMLTVENKLLNRVNNERSLRIEEKDLVAQMAALKKEVDKEKPQYFNIFKNYYDGATSTTVFGEFIVDKLQPSILQAAYEQTAIDVAEKMKRDVPAFSGNRSNLEKHILTSLAEEENFENYIEYLHKPKEHFNQFID
ncbi:hypothetical protein KOW79_011011 [Hemibagrus wyckioides]|uniref:VLIG-type G domain-containing protein n=1 Tax=Hemibagrus wyckioides TaxID=337641 RepID=A0A9D3NP49_9TELE|nr:hypothetical protein KOW79_011011 [Hemibagrus wyckioides]